MLFFMQPRAPAYQYLIISMRIVYTLLLWSHCKHSYSAEMSEMYFGLVRFALLFREFALGPHPARLLRFWTRKTVYQYDSEYYSFIKSHMVGGRLHRLDGPAQIIRYPLVDESDYGRDYLICSKLHAGHVERKGKPPVIFHDGAAFTEKQWRERQAHTERDPPVMVTLSDVGERLYYRKGLLHRDDGPAIILY